MPWIMLSALVASDYDVGLERADYDLGVAFTASPPAPLPAMRAMPVLPNDIEAPPAEWQVAQHQFVVGLRPHRRFSRRSDRKALVARFAETVAFDHGPRIRAACPDSG
jgi:hypothetical protein